MAVAVGDVRTQDVLLTCSLPLLCTHGRDSGVLLTLSRSFAHDPSLLRASSRAAFTATGAGAVYVGCRSARTLLHACVRGRVCVRRLQEVMSHAPASAFSECDRAGQTPVSSACKGVEAGDASRLSLALTIAGSLYSRAADWARVGELYSFGLGVPQDDVQAVMWLRRSADQGDAPAQYYLGAMYERGRGVPQDDVQAVAWYRRSAEQGFASAQYNLGVMCAEGRGGVRQDNAEAVAWYRRSAEQGEAHAQCNLGAMYEQGRGVPQDYVKAVTWYRRAAQQGFAGAQHNLGLMYDAGRGVPQDYVQAVALYRRAAGQGTAPAQCNLGNMYTRGHGVPQDYVQAVAWY